ncbi:CpsD/CapB family tyrosine-protein kinase [Enterococcus sp. S22(2020)]|nr:CpsD/CapB family tyrosine-protein kinase [Enterococcus sp. S23]MCA5017438.1 CpsD/CapB family tyrosine-protein kinase [Enterococcus sp. S22(2020)]
MDYLSANAFRDLKTNIDYQMGPKNEKIFVLTSANQGEGKSYCALNVALAFAESKKRVLLIDMDLHRPRLTKQFGSVGKPGVSNMYEDHVSYLDCLVFINNFLSFIPCGRSSLNPSEVLASPLMIKEIRQALERFDLIIIDSPPVRLSPDTKTILSIFKNVLFVVREGQTKKSDIEESLESIKLINPSVLGMVLNFKKFSKKDRKRYGYK